MANLRDELLDYLGFAAELEHLLMCQYLFAAYSLKRGPDEGLDPERLERVRRWGTKVTYIARQEMAHLGIVMNLRAANGGEPVFGRAEFPVKNAKWGALSEQDLLPFTRASVTRFLRFEAPGGDEQEAEDAAPPVSVAPPASASPRLSPGLLPHDELTRRLRDSMRPQVRKLVLEDAPRWRRTEGAVEFNSISDLYLQIYDKFVAGGEALFDDRYARRQIPLPGEVFAGMNSLNQYGLDLVRVEDLDSAKNAIATILVQGEGTSLPNIGYSVLEDHTHYGYFTSILQELGGLDFDGIEVCRAVVANPTVRSEPRAGQTPLQNDDTRQVAELFNRCYRLMLAMLHCLYGESGLDERQLTGLANGAFFPLMTMFIRPLAEVLTLLPAGARDERVAGAPFELWTGDEQLELYPSYASGWFGEELERLSRTFRALDPKRYERYSDQAARRLEAMAQHMARLSQNWNADWENVGRTR